MRFNLWSLVLTSGMLISGATLTISKKWQNEIHSSGWKGNIHSFDHPYVQTSMMFLGESTCILAFFLQQHIQKKQSNPEKQPLTAAKHKLWQPILLIPSLLDLVGTTCTGIGLVYLDASLYQMLRGSSVIFASVFGWLFLNRSMLPHRWIAISSLIIGLGFVGASGLLAAKQSTQNSSDISSSSPLFSLLSSVFSSQNSQVDSVVSGVVMVLTGQMITGVQVVVEEGLLRQQKFEPLHVIGFEGVLGFIIMSFLILPILLFIPGNQPSPLNYDSYENVFDALIQIFHNPLLLVCSLGYIFSAMLFSLIGLYVTKQLTCVHRTIIDSLRTVFVWTFELLIGLLSKGKYGERWTKYSFIRVAGFLLLLLGAVLFNGIIRIPGLEYDKDEIVQKQLPQNSINNDYKTTHLISPSQSATRRWDEQ